MKTFVVRIWTPLDPAMDPDRSLRGTAERVGSGESRPFADESELLAFLREFEQEGEAPPDRPTAVDRREELE